MGYPRISALLVLEEGGSSSAVAALRAREGGARQDRKHRAVSELPVSGIVGAGSRVAFDLGMKTPADLEAMKAAVLAHCNRPDVLAAVVEWHDCGEDEPEPVHLPSEHPEYQAWRAGRDCSRRGYGRFEKNASEAGPGSGPDRPGGGARG